MWNFMIRFYLFRELWQDFFLHSNASFCCLCVVKLKVPPRPWFWSSPGVQTESMPVSCTSSPPWTPWLFAPVSASIQIASEFPPSFLTPSSHILMSSSSAWIWSRANVCSWLCWSMAFMDLTKKPSTTTTPGIRCAFLGTRMVDAGHYLLTALWSLGVMA